MKQLESYQNFCMQDDEIVVRKSLEFYSNHSRDSNLLDDNTYNFDIEADKLAWIDNSDHKSAASDRPQPEFKGYESEDKN